MYDEDLLDVIFSTISRWKIIIKMNHHNPIIVHDRCECASIINNRVGRHIFSEECRKRLVRMGVVVFEKRRIKLVHLTNQNYEEALTCSERMLLIDPDDLVEIRDRGLLYRELECTGPALEDLELYLSSKPDDPRTKSLEAVVETLRKQVRRMN